MSALLVISGVRPAIAQDRFAFADDVSLAESMAVIGDKLAYGEGPPDPCRLDILSDPRGKVLFDQATREAMHSELAAAVLGAEQVGRCAVEEHEVEQNDVAEFLTVGRPSGDVGLTLILAYYQIGGSVTMFATLRGADGGVLASTGRLGLPVQNAAAEQAEASDAPSETGTEPAEPVVAAEQEPAAERLSPATEEFRAEQEKALRRQFAVERQVAAAPPIPFNLRRIQAGFTPSISTLRIVVVDEQDTGMMTDLAERFLDTAAVIAGGSVETVDLGSNGTRGTRVALGGDADAEVDAIDIQVLNSPTAFAQIVNNQADIIVTREPISIEDAANFAEIYGVNMRSRYAEHVVAIGERERASLTCGIPYPEDDMLMSTEDHPASERVYIYNNPSIPSAARDRLINFALSADGQATVARHAVDLRLQVSDPSYAAWRHQVAGEQQAKLLEVRERFRGLILAAQRISSTFRFEFASADLVLDSRSEQDLENLIDLIKSSDADSRRIHLFGFADSAGAAPYNADLSRERADSVAIRLRLAGIPIPPGNVHGIGEDSPVACDETDEGERDEVGAHKNRRVEVWIES